MGGDAGVSILIHNRLRELAAKGTKLTCIVDGVAMSGGSLIMCACDTVKANPSSLVMIHKCWSLIWGNYNADELRKAADANDAWDKSQVSIYKRKTGLSETVLLHMMSDTTYMTGKEAVEKGFANELLDDAEPVEISASADRQTIYAKGHALHLMPGVKLPDNIPMLERTIEAQKKYYKKTTLQELDVEIMKLRAYLRLSHELGFLPMKKYEVWSGMVVEIGKMLGGWLKTVNGQPKNIGNRP